MGFVYHKDLQGKASYGLWEITETTDELLSLLVLTETEHEMYQTFRTEWRQKQWLAYRALIRELLPPGHHKVVYKDHGKPCLANSHFHISVTHTEQMAGVIISPQVRVGIDMEKVRPRIARISDKFLSDEELASMDNPGNHFNLTLAWCAKEALFKLHGQHDIDFKRDMQVNMPQIGGQGVLSGRINIHAEKIDHILYYEFFRDYLIVSAFE